MTKRGFWWIACVLVIGGGLVGCSGSASTTAPEQAAAPPPDSTVVVARYADTTLTWGRLQRAYARSTQAPTDTTDTLAAYRDFLERYVNYQLKVRAARAAGLDTLRSVRREVASYRRQVAQPRLVADAVIEPLVRELYARRDTSVDVSHILLRVPAGASPKDTLAVYRRMQALRDSLQQGVPFAALARRNSEDPSAARRGARGYEGRLGYLTAGQLVKPFEDAMYATPVDSLSPIIRTRFGYHLLKVHGRRARPQPVTIAHIMIRPDSSRASARRLVDSLHTALQNGSSFERLARQFSDDTRTSVRGGLLGTVSPEQRLPPAFREAAFALDSLNQISDVVRTRFGFHILQLRGKEARPTFEDAYPELKETVARLPRSDRQQAAFAAGIRAREGMRVDTARVRAALDTTTFAASTRRVLSRAEAFDARPFAAMGDSTYTLADLRRFVQSTSGQAQQPFAATLTDFLNDAALRYAAQRLEARDPAFARTMQRYREGLLLFRFMQDSVWTAAARDTAGLRAYFRAHRAAYRWPRRAETLVFRSPSDSLLQPVIALYNDRRTFAAVAQRAASDSLIAVDTMLVDTSQAAPYPQVLDVATGEAVGPLTHEGTAYFMIRLGTRVARRKTFDEARAAVVNDYQAAYEARVMDRLRRRYRAETYPKRLRRLVPAAPDSSSTK
ncbi:peptidylprolyl isomerase [Salisaeta longa]|uniref:peptidylprolyl isomerase n=1 Tax=Salisaeta longa TaxID=503170 RepID=UPI0003B68A1F|nr:peptidylprolyl isomerase [Salisaeta longa]